MSVDVFNAMRHGVRSCYFRKTEATFLNQTCTYIFGTEAVLMSSKISFKQINLYPCKCKPHFSLYAAIHRGYKKKEMGQMYHPFQNAVS